MSKRGQKNFENVPEKVREMWAGWLKVVRSNNQEAGAVVMWMATRMSPRQWGELVEEYNQSIGQDVGAAEGVGAARDGPKSRSSAELSARSAVRRKKTA